MVDTIIDGIVTFAILAQSVTQIVTQTPYIDCQQEGSAGFIVT